MANTVKQGVSGQTIEQQGSLNVKEGVSVWNGSEFIPLGTEFNQFTDVRSFGATGIGDETSKFIAACQAAATNNKYVLIPFPSFTVANGTDCQGCFLIGSNTEITGRLINYADTDGISIRTFNQDDYCYSPTPASDLTPKILFKVSATDDAVILQKKTRGYLLSIFRINSTTNTDSLAVTTSDANRRRMATVQDVVWAAAYKYSSSATSGTWTESTLSAASISNTNLIPEAVTSGQALKYWRTTVQNSYIEFQAKPKNGLISVMLLAGTTGDTNVNITVNGTTYNVSAAAAVANTFKLFTFPVLSLSDADNVTIRVTKVGVSPTGVNVVGVNFFELKEWTGTENDTFTYYRNPSVYAEYLTQSSSNDAVIKEYNSGIYGVAYHGGETNIVSDWYSGGTLLSIPTVGNYVLSNRIELRTSADVSWASVGGGSVNVASRWQFGNGQISHQCMFTGNVIVSEIYNHMFGANEAFTSIIYPIKADLSVLATGTRVSLGRGNRVILENPTTKQRYIAEYTQDGVQQNQYGGAHVWKVVGSYHKLYAGKCLGGKMTITNYTLTSNHTFE